MTDGVKTPAEPRLSLLIYSPNTSGRQSSSDARASLTCSHSTLAKQNVGLRQTADRPYFLTAVTGGGLAWVL